MPTTMNEAATSYFLICIISGIIELLESGDMEEFPQKSVPRLVKVSLRKDEEEVGRV